MEADSKEVARPSTLTACGDEAQKVFARHRAGEIHIDAMERGRSNAEWIFEISYPTKDQPELL